MGMSVTISAATEQDAEQIFKLQYLCFQSEAALYGNYRIDPLVQTLASSAKRSLTDCVFVARLGEEVVGSVRGRVIDDGSAPSASSVVHPRLQGHGIGARLLRAAESALAGERGATQLPPLHGPPQREQPAACTAGAATQTVGTAQGADGVTMIVLEKPAGAYAATA